MPELPEVEALARYVAEQAVGKKVTRAELAAFAALKTFDPPLSALVGRTLVGTTRRGKFLCFDFEPLWLVLHLARGGWLQWKDELTVARAKPARRSPLALRVGYDDGSGFDVTEAGTEKRLAAYVVEDPSSVEGIGRLGPDPFDPALDADALGERLRSHRGTLKAALADQSVLAGVGNAYSDEVMHAAKLSPFKSTAKLTDAETKAVFDALRSVLADALERSLGLPAKGLKSEKKSGLKVHNRTGEPCPVCGETVREVSYATKSFQYCPGCQTGGKVLADRRLSRLIK
jgi:formamidopyrimidine-DNA glycosylase